MEVENIGPNLNCELNRQRARRRAVAAPQAVIWAEGCSDFSPPSRRGAGDPRCRTRQLVDQATANYAVYVEDQTAQQLVDKTTRVRRPDKSGEDDAAKGAVAADARVHWERVETVAESFGDLDPTP